MDHRVVSIEHVGKPLSRKNGTTSPTLVLILLYYTAHIVKQKFGIFLCACVNNFFGWHSLCFHCHFMKQNWQSRRKWTVSELFFSLPLSATLRQLPFLLISQEGNQQDQVNEEFIFQSWGTVFLRTPSVQISYKVCMNRMAFYSSWQACSTLLPYSQTN